MTPEEIMQIKAENDRLQQENAHLRAFTVLPIENHQTHEPSGLEVDPLFKKLESQLQQLREANLISAKVLELSQQSEQAMAAIIPALEVQFHGMNNEIAQLKVSSLDLENTYASVVEKLEGQVKVLRQRIAEEEKTKEERLAQLEAHQARMAGELQRYQKLSENYEAELMALKEAQARQDEKSNPFTSLNIFDL